MKKINSEIEFDNESFKVKIGTVDKKNPTTLFFTIGTYITPIETNEDFKSSIEKMKRKINNGVENFVKKSTSLQNNYIFVSDIAVDRISYGKKSYFETNLYIKPTQSLMDDLNGNFTNIAYRIKNDYMSPILEMFGDEIFVAGYRYSKNKN